MCSILFTIDSAIIKIFYKYVDLWNILNSYYLVNESYLLEYIIFISCFNIATLIFLTGCFGLIWNKKNLIFVIVSIELIFLGLGLYFALLGFYMGIPEGQIYSILILAVSASESIVLVSLLVLTYRLGGLVDYKELSSFKECV